VLLSIVKVTKKYRKANEGFSFPERLEKKLLAGTPFISDLTIFAFILAFFRLWVYLSKDG